MTDPQTTAQLKGLRDFFVAANAAQLEDAYNYLADWVNRPAPVVADWQQVEFGFNRLFVGPRAPVAPPFASVYLEPEPQLMGQSTRRVRRIYELVGLQSPLKNRVPDDHISFELDACRQLAMALVDVPSAELAALRSYLINRHMGQWLPQFIQRVRTADTVSSPVSSPVPDAIEFVVDCLESWLTQELSAADSTPTFATDQPHEQRANGVVC